MRSAQRTLLRGFECIREMFDQRYSFAVRPGDGDHVEAGRVLEEIMPPTIRGRRPRQAALLVMVDRFGRMSGVLGTAGFHFHENYCPAFDCDDVDLAEVIAMAHRNDDVAL